jgi:phage FluMu protein Com
MQPNQAQAKKCPETKVLNFFVVRVGNDKAGQTKKEVDRQIAVRNKILAIVRNRKFHEMENKHADSGNSA